MSPPHPATARPDVSVIVPARNEEVSLGACLESLIRQIGVSFEIIVVDDSSTDRTREIAQSFAGVKVIDAGPLPDSWTGKNNAMAAGVKVAKGKWLLFTDADTVHSSTSLAQGLTEAELRQAQLLSYSPQQEVRGFWEKAVMPVIFAELAATYPPAKINDPASSAAAANGQYLLISREAYDAAGGHAKIASDLLEDVALARLVKSSGRRIFFRYGGDVVRTRMYRGFAQMEEGWTKNLALLFRKAVKQAWAVGFRYFMTLAGSIWVPILIAGPVLHPKPPLLGLLFMGFPLAEWLRIRKAHFSWGTTTIALYFGQPMFLYLLFRSKSRNKSGGVTWKGREYLPSPLHGHSWKRNAIGTGK